MSQSKSTVDGGGGGGGVDVTVESPPSSCVSSDAEEEEVTVAKQMLVVGCPQCLMYVMLSEGEQQPKCPRCKSPALLNFLQCNEKSSKNTNKS